MVFPKENLYLSFIYCISLCTIIFGLNWYQIIIFIAIDTISFFLVHPIEKSIFAKLYPQFHKVRDYQSETINFKDSPEKQAEFFQSLSDFPEARSFHLLIASLVKVLPVGIFVSYVSTVRPEFYQNLILFYITDIFIIVYSIGLLFIQLHTFSSEIMDELRNAEGWKDNYRNLKLAKEKDRLHLVQNVVLVFMLTNLLLMILFIHGNNTDYFHIIIFLIAIICLGDLQFKFQRFFSSSLFSTFKHFKENLVNNRLETLPLHTTPVLAGFEYTFNQMGFLLDQREKEISQWLKHESEQFHLRSLGEIAALVAHDIKTPLHVMQMSLDMINDPYTTEEEKVKYQKILEKNLNETISFSQTLMAYLRGTSEKEQCLYGDVHQHLLKLFQTQFNATLYSGIKFNISPELSALALDINRLNVMHIFYNLYQNAIKAVLRGTSEFPEINVWTEKCDEAGFAYIFIKDNGSGMKEEAFKQLISFERFQNSHHFYEGLGLRLSHSILTHFKGSIDLVEVEEGTCLKVKFPVHT